MDEHQACNRKGNAAACLGVPPAGAEHRLDATRQRSVQRKFARAQRNDDVLLTMTRGIRRSE